MDFLCRSGKIVPIAQRCILDYDVYGDVTGCRDLSHLDDCGIFLSPENMYIYKKNSHCNLKLTNSFFYFQKSVNARWDS